MHRAVGGRDGKPGPAVEIDPGKLAEEARFDGVFVLRTNARVMPLQAVLRYRDPLSAAGRGSVPPRQGDPQDPSDLSFQRRRYPRPCLLLVPRPDAAEGAGRSVLQPRPGDRMGRPATR